MQDRAVRITSNSARFSSLTAWDSERIEVNQILGSDGLGLNSPLAIANIRSRIFSCGVIPTLIIFILPRIDRRWSRVKALSFKRLTSTFEAAFKWKATLKDGSGPLLRLGSPCSLVVCTQTNPCTHGSGKFHHWLDREVYIPAKQLGHISASTSRRRQQII